MTALLVVVVTLGAGMGASAQDVASTVAGIDRGDSLDSVIIALRGIIDDHGGLSKDDEVLASYWLAEVMYRCNVEGIVYPSPLPFYDESEAGLYGMFKQAADDFSTINGAGHRDGARSDGEVVVVPLSTVGGGAGLGVDGSAGEIRSSL